MSCVENVMASLLRLCWIDRSCVKLCSSLILRSLLWELCFALWMNMLRDFLSFSYWGFMAQLEVRGEWYEFSKVDPQTMIWGKKEIVTFGNIIRSLYIIMNIAQVLVSSTTSIMYWSLLGLEKQVKWAWEWNLRSGEGNETR